MRRCRAEYQHVWRLTFLLETVSILDTWFRFGASFAGMVELADAQDLGSCAARRVGSTPTTRIQRKAQCVIKMHCAFLMLRLPFSLTRRLWSGVLFLPAFSSQQKPAPPVSKPYSSLPLTYEAGSDIPAAPATPRKRLDPAYFSPHTDTVSNDARCVNMPQKNGSQTTGFTRYFRLSPAAVLRPPSKMQSPDLRTTG